MRAELVELARENSSERRRELLSRISAEFLDGSADYSDLELVMFCDVLSRLLDQMQIDVRAQLAESVADSERASERLHLRLARDAIEVAEPILLRSSRLSDEALAELAGSQSEAHVMAITRREHLSLSVTDAVVARGGPEVLVSVTENFGAEISDKAFHRLADAANDHVALQNALTYRGDMPADVARRLMAILPRRARERLSIVLRCGTESTERFWRSAACEIEDRRQMRRRERMETKAMIADIRRTRAGLGEVLFTLAELNRVMDIALVISEFTDLRESVTNQMLLKAKAAPIALVLRFLNVSEVAVEAVARAWCRRLVLSEARRQELMAVWHATDGETAGRVMRFTRVRSHYGGDAAAA